MGAFSEDGGKGNVRTFGGLGLPNFTFEASFAPVNLNRAGKCQNGETTKENQGV